MFNDFDDLIEMIDVRTANDFYHEEKGINEQLENLI